MGSVDWVWGVATTLMRGTLESSTPHSGQTPPPYSPEKYTARSNEP